VGHRPGRGDGGRPAVPGRAAHGELGGLGGEQQVRPGVAVRDGVDVERVDLVAGREQGPHAGGAPGAQGGGVESSRHGAPGVDGGRPGRE
jgi:hypothetical protein